MSFPVGRCTATRSGRKCGRTVVDLRRGVKHGPCRRFSGLRPVLVLHEGGKAEGADEDAENQKGPIAMLPQALEPDAENDCPATEAHPSRAARHASPSPRGCLFTAVGLGLPPSSCRPLANFAPIGKGKGAAAASGPQWVQAERLYPGKSSCGSPSERRTFWISLPKSIQSFVLFRAKLLTQAGLSVK